MALTKSINKDSTNTWKMLPRLTLRTKRTETPSFLLQTSSLTIHQLSTENFLVTRKLPPTVFKYKRNTMPVQFQSLLTGELREPLTQLRTNVNVVHAGLSQLLVLLKVDTSSRLANSSPFQSNNSLIAILLMETKVAMVEIWQLLSHTFKKMVLRLRLTTHTQVKMINVHSIKANLKFLIPITQKL